MPPLNFAVALRIERRGSDVGHAADADEGFEVFGDELRTVVADDAWTRTGEKFLGFFEDDFNVGFRHGLANIPMNDEAAAPVEHAEKVVEGAANVDVGNVDMQCSWGFKGCTKPVPFFVFSFQRCKSPA